MGLWRKSAWHPPEQSLRKIACASEGRLDGFGFCNSGLGCQPPDPKNYRIPNLPNPQTFEPINPFPKEQNRGTIRET